MSHMGLLRTLVIVIPALPEDPLACKPHAALGVIFPPDNAKKFFKFHIGFTKKHEIRFLKLFNDNKYKFHYFGP